LECNQAFCDLFGFASKEEALQASLSERYPRPEDRAKFIEELSREKRIALREATYKKVDGAHVYVYETVTGIFDQEGKLNGAIGFLIDVTERKALEEQLRQAQKMEAVGQLAAGVAHDFNNILMAIQGASELLSKTVPKGQPGHKDIVTIQKAAERAALITRQLLGFARKSVLDLAPYDPNRLIEDLLPMLNRLLPETIRVEFIQSQDAGFINVDKGQMEQVIMNLCVNARDAMPKGGKLTLETENVLVNGDYIETHPWAKAGRYVLISVTDTGTGMNPELLSKIFEPFFTTKPQGKGTGLGLSMVYGIVKQHEGMINVYSEPGVGTTFKIYLPMVERRAAEVGTKVERAVTGGHETILVVEDDKEVRNVVVEVLMSLGYKVLFAGDGAEALAVLRRTEGVSLVITDIVMPKMGGKELRMATRQIYPALRFIFTSGYTQNVVHHDFVLEKGVAFLSKPYGIDTLARKVREVLDGKDAAGG
jgi:PAS domain S-box-containing protein